jgi:DNA-binding transcriptional ArsR family regulator
VPAVATLDVMEVLAAPSRREIVDLLRDGALAVNTLVARLDLTQPAVSKHLRVLREAGLVRVQADGRQRLYELRPEPLMELAEWLEPYREMWRESLDRLERHLDDVPVPHNSTGRPPAPVPSEPTVTRKKQS